MPVCRICPNYMDNELYNKVVDILRKNNIPGFSFVEMEREWKKFVDRIKSNGYDDYLVEFDNDISVRDKIEKVLSVCELEPMKEFQSFRAHINEIDEDLKSCFMSAQKRTDGRYWWRQGILINGSGDYADDIKQLYKIDIKPIN